MHELQPADQHQGEARIIPLLQRLIYQKLAPLNEIRYVQSLILLMEGI